MAILNSTATPTLTVKTTLTAKSTGLDSAKPIPQRAVLLAGTTKFQRAVLPHSTGWPILMDSKMPMVTLNAMSNWTDLSRLTEKSISTMTPTDSPTRKSNWTGCVNWMDFRFVTQMTMDSATVRFLLPQTQLRARRPRSATSRR
jgi:hypothetical protein